MPEQHEGVDSVGVSSSMTKVNSSLDKEEMRQRSLQRTRVLARGEDKRNRARIAHESKPPSQAPIGSERKAAARRWSDDSVEHMDLLKKFDKSKDQRLDRAELKKLMQQLSRGGYEVLEREVDFVIFATDDSGDGSISAKELDYVYDVWTRYVRELPSVVDMLEKHDIDRSGTLEKAELKQLLVDLNDGLPVEDDDVDWVLLEADFLGDGEITRVEVLRAIQFWYLRSELNEKYMEPTPGSVEWFRKRLSENVCCASKWFT